MRPSAETSDNSTIARARNPSDRSFRLAQPTAVATPRRTNAIASASRRYSKASFKVAGPAGCHRLVSTSCQEPQSFRLGAGKSPAARMAPEPSTRRGSVPRDLQAVTRPTTLHRTPPASFSSSDLIVPMVDLNPGESADCSLSGSAECLNDSRDALLRRRLWPNRRFDQPFRRRRARPLRWLSGTHIPPRSFARGVLAADVPARGLQELKQQPRLAGRLPIGGRDLSNEHLPGRP